MTRNQTQKQLEMDLKVRLTESQYEAMKIVAEASGDTLEEWLHACVIQGIEADIELYFGVQETIKERLYKMVNVKHG
jgi:hypothetical protein